MPMMMATKNISAIRNPSILKSYGVILYKSLGDQKRSESIIFPLLSLRIFKDLICE